MLPETQLLESKRMLSHYLGVFLAEPNPTISAHTAAMAPDLVRQELQNIARERQRAMTYCTQYVSGPRVTALQALIVEVDALVVEAEAALA